MIIFNSEKMKKALSGHWTFYEVDQETSSFSLFKVSLKWVRQSNHSCHQTEKIQNKNEENMIQLSSKLVFHTHKFLKKKKSMILAFKVTLTLVFRLWSLNIIFHLKGLRALREMSHCRLKAGNVQNKPGLFCHTRKD